MTSVASAIKRIEDRLNGQDAERDLVWNGAGFSDGAPILKAEMGNHSAMASFKNGSWSYRVDNVLLGTSDTAEGAMRQAARKLVEKDRERLEDAKNLFKEYDISLDDDKKSNSSVSDVSAIELAVKSLEFLSKSKVLDAKLTENPKLKSALAAAERFFEKKSNRQP